MFNIGPIIIEPFAGAIRNAAAYETWIVRLTAVSGQPVYVVRTAVAVAGLGLPDFQHLYDRLCAGLVTITERGTVVAAQVRRGVVTGARDE